ncbi:NAD(P)/FAD-dependent oxidoreductase [Heliorestis acidaminivorans]|uniref:NAD(P)/FAD-dependent oxidoreductase n=1 Tax=Heliorestis acidaminivorans TaxID=553427 RepID=A0A6I0EWZ9_9FIRM|nr:NAD(P)/FAD-dependent oxidoreductase [Heliorestis acidaminivorans]KAB2954329.1 NAD(P)/FAD-dependent oxidoreductase [Heliorestis acidaminivorans]
MRFDTVIIGAGPAGLSTAIQLARYNYSVLVFDGGDGRASWVPKFHNYLGFPQGVSGKDILRLGREQAQKYGAEIVKSQVVKIEHPGEEEFLITTSSAEYQSRRLVLATGIQDIQPEIVNRYDFAGRSIFYCLDCNSYEFSGQKAVVFGHNERAIFNALGLLDFTHQIYIATNGVELEGYEKHKKTLEEYSIDVITEPIERLHGQKGVKGKLEEIEFQNGEKRPTEIALSTYGYNINNQLVEKLNLETNHSGHIKVGKFMDTNIKNIYAVGDIVDTSQMLVLAVSEGIKAAIAIHRSLQSQRKSTVEE